MADWSEEAFLDRVRRRVRDLGKSESALLRDAGVSQDLIRKGAEHGRRIDSIAAIAGALDWTLAEAIGVQPAARVDLSLLARAILVADQLIPRQLDDRAALVSRAAALFYDILSERKEAGRPILDDSEALALADALIRGMGLSEDRSRSGRKRA
jgi:hypothetical protein